jgi:hypothetical protein
MPGRGIPIGTPSRAFYAVKAHPPPGRPPRVFYAGEGHPRRDACAFYAEGGR